MISCALNRKQIEVLYKAIYTNMIKDKNFTPDVYMQSLFNKIKTKKDAATAAKFIQQAPGLVLMALQRRPDLSEGFIDRGIDMNKIFITRKNFLADDGLVNVIKEFSTDPADLKDLGAQSDQDKLDTNREDVPLEQQLVTYPQRFKSLNPFTGTIQNFVTIDPKSRSILFAETADPARQSIINTLTNLRYNNNIESNGVTEFTYQDRVLKLKAMPLTELRKENPADIDPSTEKQIQRSLSIISQGTSPKNVTQVTDRVALVLVDQFGNYVRFNEQGNIANEGGKLVYQFLRDIRKDSKGKYTSTDIYGKETRVADASTVADALEISVEEAQTYLQESFKSLEKLKNSVIKKKDAPLLDITGLTNGIATELTQSTIKLNDLQKVPGLDAEKAVASMKTENTGQNSGKPLIYLNGTGFVVDRVRLSSDIINEIAEVVTNKNFTKDQRTKFIQQFVYNNPKNLGSFQLIDVNGNLKLSDINNKNIINLANSALDNLTEPQVNSLKETIKKLLSEAYTFEGKKVAAYMQYNKDLLNAGSYTRYDSNSGQFKQEDFIDFLLQQDAKIFLSNLNPGFYNIQIEFRDPNSKLTKEIKDAQEKVDSRSFIRRAKDELVDYLKEQEGEGVETTVTMVDEFRIRQEYKTNTVFLKNPQGEGSINLRVEFPVEVKENDKVILKVEDITADGKLFRDVVNVYLKKKKDLSLVGQVSETDFRAGEVSRSPEVVKAEETIENNKLIDDPSIPSPRNKGNISGRFDTKSMQRKGFKVTKETAAQIAEANRWWKSSPLSKYIELGHMANIVNSNVFAQFTVDAATLADPTKLAKIEINKDRGTAIDIYHEAWHGFSQLYLTAKEKEALYNEVKNSSDKYKNLSYLEIEEVLAEDFRTYAKNPKPKSNSPKRNTLFRKILNFIKSLFGKKANTTINKQEVIVDTLAVPSVKELFEKLYLASSDSSMLNDYTPTIENVSFTQLNRGVRRVDNARQDALNVTDSNLVTDTIDSILSDVVDDLYDDRRKANESSQNSGTLNLLLNEDNKAVAYEIVEERLKARLETLDDKLKEMVKMPDFNAIKTLANIKSNAVAVLKGKEGVADRYVFLKNQINSFKNLDADIVSGQRILGNNFRGVDIVSDFYTHKNIKSGTDPAEIIVVNTIEEAVQQLNNYQEEGSYIDLTDIKTAPQLNLTQEQQVLLNNIRILQAAVSNFGDKNSGVMKYHMDNSRYSIINTEFNEVNNQEEITEEDEQIDENVLKDSELIKGEVGKKSLQQLADREALYIIKSLHKVNVDGSTPKNQLGFKQLADFKTTWNVLTNTISGTKSPQEMYNKLVELSEEFPELNQLIKNKLPKPENTTNTYEFDAIASFWQTFKKPAVKYYQLTAEKIDGKYSVKVNEAAIDTFTIMNEFKANFETKEAGEYILKNDANKNTLNLQKVVKDFGSNGVINKAKAVDFLNVLGLAVDNIDRVRNEIDNNFDKFGVFYIYKIANEFAKLQNKDLNQVSEKQLEILNEFLANPVKVLGSNLPKEAEVGTNQITQIGRLANLQSKYGIISKNYGVLTADGERVFPHILDHSASVMIDGINRLDNLADAFKNQGETNKPNQFEYLSWLNPKVNSFTRRSQVLNSLFQIDTNSFRKRANTSLELFIASGVNVQDNKKASSKTTDLDKFSKFSQEFHTMLMDGMQEFMRHADKKSSFGAKINGGIVSPLGTMASKKDKNLYVDVDMFVPQGGGPSYAIENIILPYVAAEFERIKKFKEKREEYSKIIGYNRKVQDGKMAGEVFTAFDDILKNTTKEELYNLDLTSSDDLVTYLNNDSDLKNKIINEIESYFNNKSDEYITDYLNESNFIDPKLINKLNMPEVEGQSEQDRAIAEKQALTQAYAYNSWIHNFEMIHLMYGDMAQYNHAKEELGKRAPGSTSGGEGFLTDVNSQNFINNVWNKNTWASTIGNQENGIKSFTYNGKMNTAIVQDSIKESKYIDDIKDALTEDYRSRKKYSESQIEALVKQDLKPYKKMEESDGGGYITLDAYRTLKKLQNQWSPPQEALYQKVLRQEDISVQDAKTYFPIYKLHYFGALANAPIATTAMHKFALMPLIPNVIKNSQLEQLHNKMMQENIQYATFGTGSKVGALTKDGSPDNIYANDSQTLIKDEANIFTPNTIYLEYLKDVTKVNSQYKGKITFPTQKRGILLDGLFDQGEILNAEKNQPAVTAYKNAVNAYTNVLKQELLSDIGFNYDKKSKTYKSINGNYTKLMQLAQDELGKRGLPEQLKKLVNTGLNNSKSMDLSLHPRPDEIEKVILAVIQNRLIKQKVKGESLIQAPVSLFNGLWDSGYAAVTDTAEVKALLGTNGLPFYNRNSERTSAMKVAIALQGDFTNLLNAKHNDGDPIGDINRLNDMIKDPKWLEENRESVTIAGPRIPTDATNSVEFAEVWHFLDPSGGNKIIVPTEIVAKAGSDFDVDKLFFMYPALDTDGKIIKTKYTQEQLDSEIERGEVKASVLIEQQKKALHNNLIKSITDILSLPDNYAALVKPNSTYLVEGVVDFLQENSGSYDRFNNVNDGQRIIEDAKGDKKKSISPTRALEAGYNLHKHEVNLTGGVTLGISALKNKMHPIFKSIGFKMPKSYKNRFGETKNIYLKLNHNQTKNGEVSLSHNNSVDGSKITDTFSHMLNAILDRAKNPFPFDLRATPEGINIINYLLEAGAVPNEVFLFMNQPLITDYLKEQVRLKSSFATIDGTGSAKFRAKALRNVLKDRMSIKRFRQSGESLLEGAYPKNITEQELKENIKNQVDYDEGALGLLYHFVELENIVNAFTQLQNVATPDTQYVRTIQQAGAKIKKAIDIEKNPILDSTSVNKLLNNSILSSFRQNELMLNIVQPLFDIRLNPTVTRYIGESLRDTDRKGFIQGKFGTGVDGAERFSTLFNNAIVNYIYQNNISGLFAEDGKAVRYPKQFKDLAVGFTKTGNKGVQIKDNKIVINRDQLQKDFKSKVWSDTFTEKQNPFPNVDSYIRYAMWNEYLKSEVYTPENLKDNKNYKRLVEQHGKEKGFNEFIAERSLMDSFNRSYIMGITKYSYTQSVLDIVREFPTLKDKFPVTRQLSKARLKKGQNELLLELNDKDIAEGDLAEGYSNDLKQLANIVVSKADNAADNKRITDVFKNFSLMVQYQHGIGFSKYSMANIIDPSKFVKLMEQPGQSFLENLDTEVLDTIYSRFMNDLIFKNYLVDTPAPQESVEEVEITEEQEEEVIEREGVSRVYKTNDTLSAIGTEEQYKEYLNTIFPESMVKDVMYRGQSKQGVGGGRGQAQLGKGVYYTADRFKGALYAGRDGVIITAIVNVQDPLIVNVEKNYDRNYDRAGIENVSVRAASTNADNPNGKDSLVSYGYIEKNDYVKYNEYTGYYTGPLNPDGTPAQKPKEFAPVVEQLALASESQVYELGSQKDLDGFAEFVGKKPATQPAAEVKSENISSKGSSFAKKLTNPGNNLEVTYKGKKFRNAEHAYQTYKSGEFDQKAYNSTAFKPIGSKPANKNTNYQTMVNILKAKLEQHPELIEGINERGGLAYIEQSTHNVMGDKFWESKGQNKFIEALADAYKSTQSAAGEGSGPVGDGPVPGDDIGLFGKDGQQNRTNRDGCVG